jgi:Putative transposase
MPDVLWPLFRDNPHLTTALPALAAKIIQIRLSTQSGLRVGVMAILHTFNGKLEFNSHVHTMVTAGGLYGLSDKWIRTVYFQRDCLLASWRRAVIRLLRAALRAGQLVSGLTADELETILDEQEKRWWSVKVQNFKSKGHFLKYAGRYLRRPPIAQRRITHVGERTVTFWYTDKKLGRKVYAQCSVEEFIERWSQHIPERYQHGVRNFGLFSPRATRQIYDAIFGVLGQERQLRPKPRRWAESIRRDFGRDPLLDSKGTRMRWVRRIPPQGITLLRG